MVSLDYKSTHFECGLPFLISVTSLASSAKSGVRYLRQGASPAPIVFSCLTNHRLVTQRFWLWCTGQNPGSLSRSLRCSTCWLKQGAYFLLSRLLRTLRSCFTPASIGKVNCPHRMVFPFFPAYPLVSDA